MRRVYNYVKKYLEIEVKMSKNYKVVHLKDLDADKYLLMQEFLIGDKDGE
jgi:hypothetical protein